MSTVLLIARLLLALVFVVAGLGLAVITRLGSAPGWAVEELNW